MEAGAANVVGEEGDVTGIEEIRPRVVEIETSSEIKGTSIEEEEPLAVTREVSTFPTS